MADARTVTVGGLASASATQVSASQKAAGAQFLVLNGVGHVGTATNISTAQSYGAAGNVVLNGALASGSPAVANLGSNVYVYFTDAADDHTITATITGTILSPLGIFGQSEIVTLANASVVSSAKQYYQVTQIALSGATAGNLSVGTYAAITLDQPRILRFTSAGNDGSITATITGTDWTGTPLTEVRTLANATTADGQMSFLTVSSIAVSGAVATTITVGTVASGSNNTGAYVAYSPWIRLDNMGARAETALELTIAGTANATVQQALRDPNSLSNPLLPYLIPWTNHPDSNLVGVSSGTVQGNYAYTPLFCRVALASGAGSATLTAIQNFQK